jgi:SM-20-related protein
MPPQITIPNEVAQKSYSIRTGFLSSDQVRAIGREMEEFLSAGKFNSAGVGNREKHKQDLETRRDRTCWFNETTPTLTQKLITLPLEELRAEFNQELFLGLFALEGHYALYETGAFYRRHRDSFKNDDSRVLSIVLYLNENWEPGDGGELRLFTPEGPVTVEPRGGTLVTFLSHELEHEVLEAAKSRRSFAGWFKKRPVTS